MKRRLEDQASEFARSPEGTISWREDVLYSARLEARMWRRLTAPIVLMMAVGLTWGSVLSVQQGQAWAIGWVLLVPPLAAAMLFGIFKLGRNRARDGLVTLTESGFSYLPGPMERRQTLAAGGISLGAYVTGNGPITRPAKAVGILQPYEAPWTKVTRVRVWEPDCVVELLRADIPLIRCYCPPDHFKEVVAYVRDRLPDVAFESGVWRWI